MRRIVLGLGAALLAACAKPDAETMDKMEAMAPAMVNMADLAGTWTVQVMGESSDSVLLTYTMAATAMTDGWTISLPGRPTMPMTVSVAGDSVMTMVAPYESVLRKGVQVSTESVARLVDGKMMGTSMAHYVTSMADSVVRLRFVGTKNP